MSTSERKNEATMKMKAKLDAFLAKATSADISALLSRTNYEFYKHVRIPASDEDEQECLLAGVTLEIPVVGSPRHGGTPNRPVTFVGRGPYAADHQDLALAA